MDVRTKNTYRKQINLNVHTHLQRGASMYMYMYELKYNLVSSTIGLSNTHCDGVTSSRVDAPGMALVRIAISAH